jgi:hypothetical protein
MIENKGGIHHNGKERVSSNKAKKLKPMVFQRLPKKDPPLPLRNP